MLVRTVGGLSASATRREGVPGRGLSEAGDLEEGRAWIPN